MMNMILRERIAILATTPATLSRAQQLAEQLQLNIVHEPTEHYAYLLTVTPTHLEIRSNSTIKTNPLIIDWWTKPLQQRSQTSGRYQELLARAVGVHAQKNLAVIDATAGLGNDAFLLAQWGAQVTMLERSPLMAALLADALERYHAVNTTLEKKFNLTLVTTDALTFLQQLLPSQYPDIIYLDPMYPERTKSALNKKAMRYLRDLVGPDPDSIELLTIALMRATKRIVVKRPHYAPVLLADKLHHQLKGKAVRFDVYGS